MRGSFDDGCSQETIVPHSLNSYANPRFRWLCISSLTLVTLLTASTRTGAGTPVQTTRVLKHTHSDGEETWALFFRSPENSLPESATQTTSRDHLIYVDTSASQIGAHRLHALAVVDSLLKSIPAVDRVRLFAIDVQAEELMPTFDHPISDVTSSAIRSLKSRIPLGATNLHALFKTALSAMDATRSSTVVYIGDGMSTAELLSPDELREVVNDLRARRIPFHSYGVGPQINLQLLGILAHQTGGYVDYDHRIDSDESHPSHHHIASTRGQLFAEALSRSIIYPRRMTAHLTSDFELLPLPLRTDRDTIHIIRGSKCSNPEVTFVATDTAESFDFALAAPTEPPDSAFLCAAFDQVQQDKGLNNPFAGRPLMQVFQQEYQQNVTAALKLGQQQIERGQLNEATVIAKRIAAADPHNSPARELMQSANRFAAKNVSQTSTAESDIANDRTQPDSGRQLTREMEQAVRVKTEKLRHQTSTAIDESRREDPEAGLVRLKQLDNAVRASIDIAPEDRLQLLKRIEGEFSRLKSLADQRAMERVQLAEHLAQLESQKRLTEQFQLDEEKLEGLIDRVRALMLEGKHGRDDAYAEAQNVADVAIDLRPGEGTSAAARFDAESAHQLTRAYRLRARRADQLLETLHQVELSHIPFPDEPPVRYPPAEVWAALTQRRKQWADVDLRRDSPRERRIREELKSPTEVEFSDIPLRDALDYVEGLHHIEIWIDDKSLSDEGISTEQTVNLKMSGISLRSVLRLLLEPLTLGYVIEDEVLKVTTQEKIEEKMQTRVYPVADLVMPITSSMMGRGGMGGGMGGGMMGGMGGGMMGGMGGGFFSIPAESLLMPAAQIRWHSGQAP